MFKKKSPNYHLTSTSSDDGCITTIIESVEKDGLTQVVKRVGSSSDLIPELPAPDNFSLQAQLDAGARLDYVDTNLLSPSEKNSVIKINELSKKSVNNENSEN